MQVLGWSLNDIDECDMESLMQLFSIEDPNVRVIDGVTYRRSKGVPDFL